MSDGKPGFTARRTVEYGEETKPTVNDEGYIANLKNEAATKHLRMLFAGAAVALALFLFLHH